jgi:hypothetical protein
MTNTASASFVPSSYLFDRHDTKTLPDPHNWLASIDIGIMARVTPRLSICKAESLLTPPSGKAFRSLVASSVLVRRKLVLTAQKMNRNLEKKDLRA